MPPHIFFLNWFGRETGTKIRDHYATFGDRLPTELGNALDT
jgi:hypothetical protein